MAIVTSRVFMNGNSQAVRIPQEFRLDVSRVQVSRNEHGDLVIHPVPADRGLSMLQALHGFDDDVLTDEFVSLVAADRLVQPVAQERDAL
jgi:antitoxin VapB